MVCGVDSLKWCVGCCLLEVVCMCMCLWLWCFSLKMIRVKVIRISDRCVVFSSDLVLD